MKRIRPLNVLVVEDDPDHFDILKIQLSRIQHLELSLTWDRSLGEGIETLGKGDFGLIMLDLTLPDSRTSETVASMVTANERNVPIIAMTALDDGGLAMNCVLAGASKCLSKTVLSADLLSSAIDAAVDQTASEAPEESSAQGSSISPEWSLFAGRAVHDLNSLVSKIAFRCETVREEYSEQLEGEGQAHLDKALQVCRQITSLVGSMGRFVDAEAVAGQPRSLDLQAIVPRLHRDVARAYGRFDADIECGPMPMVRGDREEITYLFMQLFDNSFKFSGDLVPKVSVSSTEKDGRCHIEVTDDGAGIGLVEDRLDMVLEPFVRLDPHGPIPGTGLGLFRCRRIVKRHGGKLVVSHLSDIGGVKHSFSLPLAKS